jgi:hypothetical protein
MGKPWEQIEGETDAAYVRFLAYRNLGPNRSMLRAYYSHESIAEGSRKKPSVPGNWQDDSTTYDWVARSQAWDIENLITQGERIITKYISTLDALTDKTLTYLTDATNQPDSWESAVKALELISKIVSGDSANELYRHRATWARDGENSS